MEEEKQVVEAAKALGLGEVVPEVYRDMLQPAAREIGDGLATVAKAVKLSLAPLEAGVWGYEQIKNWLSVRVTQIHADRRTEKIVQPKTSIAGPLVLQMIFAKDEPKLRELYASLLASAMDNDERSAHPAFVTIIQQMSSDEAKIIEHLSLCRQREREFFGRSGANDSLSIIHAQDDFGQQICSKTNIQHPKMIATYLDNLIRLRILKLTTYNDIEYLHGGFRGNSHELTSVQNFEETIIEVTEFGLHFMRACVEKNVIR